MQDSMFYIAKSLIAKNPNESILQKYRNVTLEDSTKTKVSNLDMNVTTHRILCYSCGQDSFLIDGSTIKQVTISEHGILWGKQYHLKLMTDYGKVKFTLQNYKQAHITISSMIKNRQWTKPPKQKQQQKATLYSGVFKKIQDQKKLIQSNSVKVSGSFTSFQNLFGNLGAIKQAMKQMKGISKQELGQNSQISKILKDIGFISAVNKRQAGRDYIKMLANDLYSICNNKLFQQYGGIVSLLDLFYLYNMRRQTQLVSPQQLLQACEQFGYFGFHAKLVTYPNNIKMIQSTLFNQQQDFEKQFSSFFKDYKNGYLAQDISNKKNLPLTIVQIKLKKACQRGTIAIDSRIQGVKYYKNLLLTI